MFADLSLANPNNVTKPLVLKCGVDTGNYNSLEAIDLTIYNK